MDVDMLPKCDFDQLFHYKIPGGTFRGATDNCPTVPRPKASFYTGGDGEGYEAYLQGDALMGGGVNRGLIHFQPCTETYRDMLHAIFGPERWEPYGNCAEQ